MDQPHSEENVRDLLDRRERELIHQINLLQQEIAALRHDLTPKEVELIEVRRAKSALGITTGGTRSIAHLTQRSEYRPVKGDLEFEVSCRDLATAIKNTPHGALKIKELLVLAFLERFQQHGASPAELKAEIQASYGREIDPGSIRPNLARLREDGIVTRAFPPRWVLLPEAARIVGGIYFGDNLMEWAVALAWRGDAPQPTPEEQAAAPEACSAPISLKVVGKE